MCTVSSVKVRIFIQLTQKRRAGIGALLFLCSIAKSSGMCLFRADAKINLQIEQVEDIY